MKFWFWYPSLFSNLIGPKAVIMSVAFSASRIPLGSSPWLFRGRFFTTKIAEYAMPRGKREMHRISLVFIRILPGTWELQVFGPERGTDHIVCRILCIGPINSGIANPAAPPAKSFASSRNSLICS